MLLPMWNRERNGLPQYTDELDAPLLSLQRDINRMFGDMWNRFDRMPGIWNGMLASGPRTDVWEAEDSVEISIELPGMNEKDIDVSLTRDFLTIRGEKKAEFEEKKRDFHLSERSYGVFHRSIPLPVGIDADRAEARFDRGVLKVRLPKTPEAKESVKRIEVKGS